MFDCIQVLATRKLNEFTQCMIAIVSISRRQETMKKWHCINMFYTLVEILLYHYELFCTSEQQRQRGTLGKSQSSYILNNPKEYVRGHLCKDIKFGKICLEEAAGVSHICQYIQQFDEFSVLRKTKNGIFDIFKMTSF